MLDPLWSLIDKLPEDTLLFFRVKSLYTSTHTQTANPVFSPIVNFAIGGIII